jgi:hypothetical protein
MFYTIEPVRSYFSRRGYAVHLYDDDGTRVAHWLPCVDEHGSQLRGEYGRPIMGKGDNPVRFYGHDGRKVRAEAIAFARALGAREQRQ